MFSAPRTAPYVFLSALVDKGAFFLLFLFLARTVSTTEYGSLVSAFAFSNILHTVFDLGLPFYFQRESAAQNNALSQQLSATLAWKGIGLLLFLSISFLYYSAGGSASLGTPLLISLSVYLFGASSMLNGVLLGAGQYQRSFQFVALARGSMLLFLAALLSFSTEPIVLLSCVLAGASIHFISLLRHINATVGLPATSAGLSAGRNVLRSSLPMGVGLIFVAIYDRIDILLLDHFLGPDPVAIYAVAYSLYKLPHLMVGPLLVPAFSSYSKSFALRKGIELVSVTKLALLLIVTASGAICFYLLGAHTLIPMLYGIAFEPSTGYLLVLCFGLPALFLNNMTGVILNSIRRERWGMYSAIGAAGGMVLLNLFLIPRYHIWGAVITTVVTEYSILLLQAFLIHKTRVLRVRNE